MSSFPLVSGQNLSRVMNLSSSEFDRTVKSSRKIFVDFWAPWCKPCLRMDPLIERVADKHSSDVVFAKVNVEECRDIAMRYNVSSIPTYMIFNNSSPRESRIGVMSEIELERLVSDHDSF